MFRLVVNCEKGQGVVRLKRVERFLIKLVVIQLLFLLLVQVLLTQPRIAPYLSKIVYYEGVTKGAVTKSLETSK